MRQGFLDGKFYTKNVYLIIILLCFPYRNLGLWIYLSCSRLSSGRIVMGSFYLPFGCFWIFSSNMCYQRPVMELWSQYRTRPKGLFLYKGKRYPRGANKLRTSANFWISHKGAKCAPLITDKGGLIWFVPEGYAAVDSCPRAMSMSTADKSGQSVAEEDAELVRLRRIVIEEITLSRPCHLSSFCVATA